MAECFSNYRHDDSFIDRFIIYPSNLSIGVVKLAIGVTVGGLFGLVAFRTGGMRAASVATGAGVALGSTYERIRAGSK